MFFSGDTMSERTLAELAEEYHTEAVRIKKKIRELRRNVDLMNPAAENHTLAVYESMYADCIMTYHTLKEYYDGDQRNKHNGA